MLFAVAEENVDHHVMHLICLEELNLREGALNILTDLLTALLVLEKPVPGTLQRGSFELDKSSINPNPERRSTVHQVKKSDALGNQQQLNKLAMLRQWEIFVPFNKATVGFCGDWQPDSQAVWPWGELTCLTDVSGMVSS